jgi:hypothetical protein
LDSASFWVDELPRYADRNQTLADAWSIFAGVVASVTGLLVWPVLSDSSTSVEKAVVSAGALAAAISALIPRVKNYAERAGRARELTSRYGNVKGQLVDAVEAGRAGSLDHEAASAAVGEFAATKEKKDALRGLPDRAAREERLSREREMAALELAGLRERRAHAEQDAVRAEHDAQAERQRQPRV